MVPPASATSVTNRTGADPAVGAPAPARKDIPTGDPTTSALCVEALRRRTGSPALVSADRTIDYGELASRVVARRRQLGTTPTLVTLHGSNTLDFVVTYLAALDAGHPVVIAPTGASAEDLTDRFDVDVVVAAGSDGVEMARRRPPPRRSRRWHPDLAALMTTSGSTGSSKLVRLSASAVRANAVSIARSLDLSADDRAITSLPLHYCYGLSVVTSHLAVGASVVLTDASVADPCFWRDVADHGVTVLAGVPFTFEMIERVGVDVLDGTDLRLLTQAGGAMAPGDVERWRRLADERGGEFVVMYGQTEATARMAATSVATGPGGAPGRRPAVGSVGRAIPGGSIRIDPLPGVEAADGRGEIVYRGPNVMMGYAHGADDLRRGHDVDELRTGDLGRVDEHGDLVIVGRLRRFVKLHGKRVDLDDVRRRLVEVIEPGDGVELLVEGDDRGLVVALRDPAAAEPEAAERGSGEVERDAGARLDPALRGVACDLVDVPHGRVLAIAVDRWPRTTSGKVASGELIATARRLTAAGQTEPDGGAGGDHDVAGVFEAVLGTTPADTDSFASLGGDSLSYVEVSLRLESVLGSLPAGWHLATVAELDAMAAASDTTTATAATTWWRRRSVALDTSVVVRAIGIALIVCTHMGIHRVAGGAHALLAVVGFNVARFQLGASSRADGRGPSRHLLASAARVAVPTSVWIALNAVLVGGYSLGAVLLVNNYTGSPRRADGRWEYWYFEAFVQIVVVLAIVMSIPCVRRAERASPFTFALCLLALTWLLRFEIVNLGGAYNEIFRPHTVACFVALGWCVARATTTVRRVVVTVLAAITTFGYFESVGRVDQFDRELRIFVLVMALTWLPTVRLPRPVALVVAAVAAASMWIFLVHWQVWPLFTPWLDDRAAYLATFVVGVAVAGIVERITARVRARRSTPRLRVPMTPGAA